MKYVCPVCGYVYDEDKEGKPFDELPETWVCPLCGAVKSVFRAEEAAKEKGVPDTPPHFDKDIRKLSAGELSAVFSNLARGCEKQYKEEEAALFRKLADYFAAVIPDLPDADTAELSRLIRNDLEKRYPAFRAAWTAENDRGSGRACVWGEKVTGMLDSLMRRLETEGDAFLRGTEVWVCTVCGFIYIGDKAPELCPVCKVPSWKFEKIKGRQAL